VIAQVTTLGVPFLLRVGVLLLTFAVAYRLMVDLGFTPERRESPLRATRTVFVTSLDHGLKNPPVRWVMLAAPFTSGVGFYAFYAAQPFLLELWGDSEAYAIAGLAAAVVAAAQIAGGYLAPHIRGLFHRRTSALILGTIASTLTLALLGVADWFWVALGLLVIWGLIFAAEMPIRQAYLNGMIPSQQRATVLSFDSLMGSAGGVVIQPALGRSADAYSYATSYVVGAAFQIVAVPFLLLSRRERSPSDAMVGVPEPEPETAPAPAPAT
jgi:MFS family permease